MGNATGKVYNDTDQEVTIYAFNYADGLRLIPYKTYEIAPGTEQRVEAWPHFSGLIVATGKGSNGHHYALGNGYTVNVSTILSEGDNNPFNAVSKGVLGGAMIAVGAVGGVGGIVIADKLANTIFNSFEYTDRMVDDLFKLNPIEVANLLYKNCDQIPAEPSSFIKWIAGIGDLGADAKEILDFIRDRKRLGTKFQSFLKLRVEQMVREFAAIGEGSRRGTEKDFNLQGITNEIFKDIFKFDEESKDAYIQVRKDTILGVWFTFKQAVEYGTGRKEEKLKHVFKQCLNKICKNKVFLEQLQGYFKTFPQECFILYCGAIQQQFSNEFIDGKADYSFLKDEHKDEIKKECQRLYDEDKNAVGKRCADYVDEIFSFILQFWKATDATRWDNYRRDQFRQEAGDDVNGADRAIYHSFLQFSKMGEFRIDGHNCFCMHAKTKALKEAGDDPVKFCLYVNTEEPGEDIKEVMYNVLKRMFSNQGDDNLLETYKKRKKVVKEPVEDKILYVYEFRTSNVLPLQCINKEDKEARHDVYEGIISADSWKNIFELGMKKEKEKTPDEVEVPRFPRELKFKSSMEKNLKKALDGLSKGEKKKLLGLTSEKEKNDLLEMLAKNK